MSEPIDHDDAEPTAESPRGDSDYPAWARERQKMLCRFYEEINRPEGPSDEMKAWWWAQY